MKQHLMMCQAGKRRSYPEKCPACKLELAAPDLLAALKLWKKFWDTMPKGQMGKLSFDVGLFNDSFIAMGAALKKAEGGK